MKVKSYLTLLLFYLLAPLTWAQEADSVQAYFVQKIQGYDSLGQGLYKAYVGKGSAWGVLPNKACKVYRVHQDGQVLVNDAIGEGKVVQVEEAKSTIEIKTEEGHSLKVGDAVYLLTLTPRLEEYSDLYQLMQLHIQLTDSTGNPLYDLDEIRSYASSELQNTLQDRVLTMARAYARARKSRFDTLRLDNIEGYFKGKTITEAVGLLEPRDVRSFLRYMRAVPL